MLIRLISAGMVSGLVACGTLGFSGSGADGIVATARAEPLKAYSAERWQADFARQYGSKRPYLDGEKEHDAGKYAWNVGYWVRAYARMAAVTGETQWLDYGQEIIDQMFRNTDEARVARGEIDLAAAPYTSGPQPLFDDRTMAAPSWRKHYRGEVRIEPLTDGHIAQHIMTWVDTVLSDARFAAYHADAKRYMARVRQIIDFHDSLWIEDRYEKVPGAYYNAKPGGGTWSNPVPFNQSATPLTAALLIDKHEPTPAYRDKARRLVAHFMAYVREEDGKYIWLYDPYKPNNNGPTEDMSHGGIDVAFLVQAYESGIDGVTREDLLKMARAFKENIVTDKGDVKYRFNADSRNAKDWEIDAVAIGWLRLAPHDPEMLDTVVAVMERHRPKPNWERNYLGWANILWHHAQGHHGR